MNYLEFTMNVNTIWFTSQFSSANSQSIYITIEKKFPFDLNKLADPCTWYKFPNINIGDESIVIRKFVHEFILSHKFVNLSTTKM